jgi:hypothetical protein
MALGSTQPLTEMSTRDLPRGKRRQGREAAHSSPSSAEVKHVGATPQLPQKPSWRGA